MDYKYLAKLIRENILEEDKKKMDKDDYFKPLYLCGICCPPETGTEGRGNMALTCVSYGNTYTEIIMNYISNVKALYPFFNFNFKMHNRKMVCDGRTIQIFKLNETFIDDEPHYSIGEEVFK